MIQSITAATLFNAPPPEFVVVQRITHMMDSRKPLITAFPVGNTKIAQRIANEKLIVEAINKGAKTTNSIHKATGIKYNTVKRALTRLSRQNLLNFTVGNIGQHIYHGARHA